MKTILLFLFASITSINLFASGGEIVGQVRDQSTNQGVISANVQLISRGKVIKAAVTDLDGFYTIKDLAAGNYALLVTRVGFDSLTQNDIQVHTDQMTTMNFNLQNTILAGVTIAVAKEEIHIGFESSGLPPASALDLKRLPINPMEYATTLAGAYQADYGAPITFRGSREGTTQYIIDGMKIIGVPSLPQTSIEDEMVFEGGIPAKYGDTVGGVIVINTKSFHFY